MSLLHMMPPVCDIHIWPLCFSLALRFCAMILLNFHITNKFVFLHILVNIRMCLFFAYVNLAHFNCLYFRVRRGFAFLWLSIFVLLRLNKKNATFLYRSDDLTCTTLSTSTGFWYTPNIMFCSLLHKSKSRQRRRTLQRILKRRGEKVWT